MTGRLLAEWFVVRIIRIRDSWSVVSPSLGGEGCCLQRLAMRLGYRVGEVCAELRCSDRYLRTVFLRDVGISPKEWMCQERMVMARRLLEGGGAPWVVAVELGFASLNNFRREFREVHGVSPVGWGRVGNGYGMLRGGTVEG